ncbi:hypothetical protein G7068_13890 [Leucobacter viscericola]|uniref:Uncharacterized protein n=1 Tax=Leucobacter viscericola TaxID=2714935 RepID=A0A6G7XIG6_9MICO|nr:hypothetical protein [Leucobacter viscericola]QIK64167.1 hypothetical protein G7068_13890 [Leucobacter viscericola]
MGRNKPRKPKRTHAKPSVPTRDELAQIFGRFDQDRLWATLFAAASSPVARHRATSVGVALAASLRASFITNESSRELLPNIQELVDAAAESQGIGVMHEDYISTDPTNVATVRVGDELLRYVPGLVERPIADLSRALRLADAVDDRLVRRHKFGIANVVRVALRYVDYCLNTLLPEWQPAPDIELGDEIDLPAAELDAAGRLVSADPLESLQLDQADLLALEWMTSPAISVKYDHENLTSPFGRTLRYRLSTTDPHFRWLPPTYVPGMLAHAVTELVDGLERDNHARRALRASCIDAIRGALWRFSNALVEAPPKARDETSPLTGNEIQWIVPVEGPNFIAVSILFTEDLPRTGPLSPACVTLADRVRDHDPSDGPISVQIAGGGTIKLLPGASVVPLVIVAGTSHLVAPQAHGQATLALEDLTWIAETATADDDLFRFSRDLSSPEFPSSFGWEAINYWEPWRMNDKTFFKGGISPTHMYFEAHAGEAEWERAVDLSRLEIALHGTGLPALRHAEMAEISSGNVASVSFLSPESEYDHRRGTHYAPNRIGWSLPLITPPIAIVRSDPGWTDDQEYRFLFDVCGGLIFAFDAIGESWRHAHEDLGTPGYRLWLRTVELSDEAVEFSCPRTRTEGAPCVALWSLGLEEFVQKADGKPFAANALTANALERLLMHGGVGESVAQEIGREWLTCLPFLILETKTARTKLNHLPRPWQLSPSDRSAATVSFARRLHATGIQPGEYREIEANALVRTHIAPAALEQLNDRIALHNRDLIVATGMEQLNRVYDHLQEEQGNLTRVAENLSTEWDPVARMAELASETLELRQCNEIIVEAALRLDADIDGQQPVTSQSWSALLAAADAYRTMTTLSERLYHRVAPAIIEVSSAYELTFKDDEHVTGDSWVMDGGSLNTAAATIRLGPVLDDDEVGAGRLEDAVDPAMLEAFGAYTSDLFVVLMALAQWDSFNDGRSIAITSEDKALSWVFEAAGDPDEEQRSRLRHAFQILTVSSDILRSSSWEPWQTRTRRHRLLVRPLVRRPDGTILIAPQYLLTTLSVYDNYLTQGVLPWTGEVPDKVSKALAERRSGRNKAFERTLERQLQGVGFKTIARVKPGDHARLGVPELTTEVDLVCGRNGDPNIWLIEAKDPASVYGFAETARQLRTFYGDSENKGRVKPCYATQLARKEAELKPYVEDIARKLCLEPLPDHGAHVLKTRFVTRHLTPAGYWVSRPYEVLTTSQFLAALD